MKCRYIVNEKENKATAGEASICVCVVLNKKKPIIARLLRAYAGLRARPIECKRKQDLKAIMKRIHLPVMEQQEMVCLCLSVCVRL